MDIQKYKGMEIYPKIDDKVFKILIRTLKDFGYISKFKSLEEIKKICYDSRYSHLPPNGTETYFQNMLYWIKDLYVSGKNSANGFIWADDIKKRFITLVFCSRLINSGIIKPNKNHRKLMRRYFFETYVTRLSDVTSQFRHACIIKEWPIFDEEIEKAIVKLTDNLLPDYACIYKIPIDKYKETRTSAISLNFFKPIC